MKDRIKALRKELGLTQEKFAERLNIKRNTIANYEIGRNEPIDAVISLICKEFKVSEEWLRTGKGDMFLKPQQNDLVARAAILLGERDPIFEAFISTYSKLSEGNRKVLVNFLSSFSEELSKKKKE